MLELGLAGAIMGALRRFTGWFHLSDELTSGAIARLFSPSAGYAVLAEMHRKGRMGTKEVLLATMLPSFPYELIRVFRFYLPVMLPLVGAQVAFKYIAIKLGSGLVQSTSALAYARLSLPEVENHGAAPPGGGLRTALRNSLRTLMRVVPVFLVAYLFASYLIDSGAMEEIAKYSQPLTSALSLPGASAVVMATQVVNVVAGFAIAGELAARGMLTGREVLITLIAGLVLSLPRIHLQHTVPAVFSLFPRRLATLLVLFRMGVEASIMLAILMLLLHLPP